ncbi:MAG: nuclear transport factor 2 family protein [Deltaproteobacteria bacterium]|nr:nuclear transport factor 2 family protein [Deltaproteobacteria bacterium]
MHAEIVAANEAFYAAFRNQDALAMDALWARHAPVACIHPGWGALVGRDRVIASWLAIMAAGAPQVHCRAPRVQLLGEVAFVVCDELIDGNRLIATNVLVREDDEWRFVHHHAGQVAAADDDDDDDSDDDASDDGPPSPSSLN